MVFRFFRRSANDAVIDRLYDGIVTASRARGLYADLAIPDSFEGRFESLTLHAALVLRRLQACEAPGPDMAQHLVNWIFRHFDRNLREMGVGDISVPKRMKTLAEAFLGRSKAYDEVLGSAGRALGECLARNIYADKEPADALARYVMASELALSAEPVQAFIDGRLPFPEPEKFATGSAP